jgi:hypothetical protein
MPIDYQTLDLLHADDFADFAQWHHEGIGRFEPAPGGGLRLHCFGSKMGAEGCMAFFRPTLPDHVAIEYDLTVRSHGGMVLNYLAIRGLDGEDLIDDRDRLPPRRGIMSDYYARDRGLQSYHFSISRFGDDGKHTQTSNWRRNPGGLLVGHGIDPAQEINRTYRIRIVKDYGACQLFVDGSFAHGFVDHATHPLPIPDTGKFGLRLIGTDVQADIARFRVWRIEHQPELWTPWEK